MRARDGISYTALSCAGVAAATAGCFSASSSGGGPQASFDASMDTAFSDNDAGADSSSPPVEAGGDVTVPPVDSGTAVVDSGHDAAPEAGCAPGSVAGFVVPPYVHAQSQAIICQDSEDAWFAQQCFGAGATLESCAAYATSNAADAGPDAGPFITSNGCAACLVTPANSDAGYGPGVAGTIVTPNLAGCIELADVNATGLSCAQAVQAAADCADYACKTTCPVTDDASRAAYIACTTAASTGACSTYTLAAQACIATELGDGGTAASQRVQQWCFSSSDPATQIAELALFFCSS
jgi:hypothetical protein